MYIIIGERTSLSTKGYVKTNAYQGFRRDRQVTQAANDFS